MGKRIQLVALDLDGTLLNSDKVVSERNLRALAGLQARGILVVPVTGRPAQGIPQAVLDLPGLRYTVTSNGATIRDLVTGETLLEKHLDADRCLAVLEASKDFSMVREAFRGGVGYLSQEDYDTLCARYAGTAMLPYLQSTRQVLPGTVADFLRQDGGPVEELFFLTDSVETKAKLRKTLSALPGIGFADPFPNDLEVIAGDIDKGTALVFLLDKLGIPREESLAIGDGGSDLPMLKAAGTGVAMGGSGEALIQVADFVTAGCDEDGVAAALEKYILNT